MKRIEYAAAELGYENEADWFPDRTTADFNVLLNKAAGLDCYVIERTVTTSKWRPAEPDSIPAAPVGPEPRTDAAVGR